MQGWERMRFFGFDSFEGLPEPKGIDLNGPFQRGYFTCPLETVAQNLQKAQVALEKTVLVKGWYQDTLTAATRQKHQMGAAAVIHIDSDLYESAKLALAFVTPLLQDGTVIIFDDWFQYRGHPQKGERRAFAEWLDATPGWVATEYHKEGVWRNSFIMNRRI
jgi:hypothetical protein